MFVSLSAYGGTDLHTSLNALAEAGVRQVQLSVGVRPAADNMQVLQQFGFEYMVHSNFAMNENQYRYDLVSSDTYLSEFERMFQFCNVLGIPSYSFHTGQYDSRYVQPAKAYATFVNNLKQVLELAERYNIKLATETMYPSSNSTRWVLDNEADILRFLAEDLPVGIVADAAHVKIGVTKGTMTKALLRTLLEHSKLAEIHLSDNDGLKDIHQALSMPAEWFLPLIQQYKSKAPLVYEGRMNGWTLAEVREHLASVEEQLRGRMARIQASQSS